MNTVFVSPEVWPFIRVGGLAEVSHDLPLALGQRGHQVQVVTPKTRLEEEQERLLEDTGITLTVPVSWREYQAKVFRLALNRQVTIYLVEHRRFFQREGLYGNAYGDYEDNAERFIFFSRSVLELLLALDRPVDLMHLNDWTTGLIPLYLKSLYAKRPQFGATGSLMTVHNLGKQGVFWHYDLPLTGLGWEYFTPQAVEQAGKLNFLKAGLVYADMISTVSRRYAEEILTPEMGFGLDEVLRQRRQDLVAITNGVDYRTWNPADDPNLVAGFDSSDLGPKDLCRADLRRVMGLDARSRRPVVIFVGRLLDRRGMDIFIPGIEAMLSLDCDLAVMGFGEDHYHYRLKQLAQRHAGRLAVHLGYEMDLAHKMIGGADILLMPSRYEPCGLHQMHAMRYGTVPVVRATGGLDETVRDHRPGGEGTGFKFQEHSTAALLEALCRALECRADQDQWEGVMRRGMAQDFSWDRAAARYEEVYLRACRQRRAQGGA